MDQQEYWKRSGQIPAFGDWERANDLPLTQYFECARQAGLIRYSSSSGECGHYIRGGGDLYAVAVDDHFRKPSRTSVRPPPRKKGVREKSGGHVKEQKGQVKVCGVTDPAPRKQNQLHHNQHHHRDHPKQPTSVVCNYCDQRKDAVTVAHPRLPVVRPAPKPVDEDLYKIPPELLLHSCPKRKKVPALFSCLVAACAS